MFYASLPFKFICIRYLEQFGAMQKTTAHTITAAHNEAKKKKPAEEQRLGDGVGRNKEHSEL